MPGTKKIRGRRRQPRARRQALEQEQEEEEEEEEEQEQEQEQQQEKRWNQHQKKYQFIMPAGRGKKNQAHLKGLWLSVQELQHWNPLKRHLSAVCLECWSGKNCPLKIAPWKKSRQSCRLPSIFCESGTQKMVQLSSFFGGRRKGTTWAPYAYVAKQDRFTHWRLSELLAGKYPEAWKGVEVSGWYKSWHDLPICTPEN